MLEIDMPKDVEYIINKIISNGYEAYIVGGCVRDSILHKKPMDWDITTNAKPAEIKKIFDRTIDTGIEHGTVTVMLNKEGYEVTTYRIDGEYNDHRRPSEVEFTCNLEEDLKRRDFTINAMAYNKTVGLIDIFGGINDLNNGIIKCVGNPMDRFDEDALRILRAVRFSAQLGFQIDEATEHAITKKAPYLKDISAERIQVEMTKLLISSHPEKIVDAYYLGITEIVLPEFNIMMNTAQNNPYHRYSVGMHTVIALQNIESSTILRWAILLHDIAKPSKKTTDEEGIDHFYGHSEAGVEMAKTVLRRMKLDNNTIKWVTKLIEWHDFRLEEPIDEVAFRKALSKMGSEIYPQLLMIQKADLLAKAEETIKKHIGMFDVLEQKFSMIINRQDPLSISELKINGNDLIKLGIKPGVGMGIVLSTLLEKVLENPSLNEENYLQQEAICINNQIQMEGRYN